MMTMMVVCVLLCLAPTVYADDPGVIRSSGTGTVSAEPDQGYITIGVQTKAETSATAVKENTTLMSALFATLKELGVEKKDFKTIEFSVRQDYKTIVGFGNGIRETRNEPDGFIVTNQMRVTVCDLKNMGAVLDALVSSGANRVQSISFGSSEAQKHLDAARLKAVKNVKRKATILAEGLGVKLGKVKSISESNYQLRREVYSRAGVAAAVPISGGSLTFTINVSVTWELIQGQRLEIKGPFKEIFRKK